MVWATVVVGMPWAVVHGTLRHRTRRPGCLRSVGAVTSDIGGRPLTSPCTQAAAMPLIAAPGPQAMTAAR
jgi:hypothetical protein